MSTLLAQHLEKQYHGRKVVRDVSFEVKSGEVVGLLGPNGAGKTTSFYMTVGLVKVDNGKIFLDNHDITSLAMHQRARLGISYLPQEPSIFKKLSVADNIMAILELRKQLQRSERLELLDRLMDELHISHLRDNMGISLSGGERRRVEIARALAIDPKFILLDEPFAGIDPISVIDLKQIIQQLRAKNIGILITDHNVRETLAICQRAYIVNNGEIIAVGSSQEILQSAQVRKVYLGEGFNL